MKFGESKTPGNTSVGKQKKCDAWYLCGQEAGNLWLGHTGNASQLYEIPISFPETCGQNVLK